MNPSETNQQMNEQDTVGKAIKRNLSPKKALDLAGRGIHCLTTRGVEATGREISFRVNLMLKRDPWQHRADLPLRRELAQQRKTT
ncbi:MAG: glycosyltransferase family 2 protein, partial [Pygmaiobacter massiliensis]|nr:glycosyltransferase family 2 protein [Pygmaiobacter massiliensis]